MLGIVHKWVHSMLVSVRDTVFVGRARYPSINLRSLFSVAAGILILRCGGAYAQVVGPVVIKSVDPKSAEADIREMLDRIKASVYEPLALNDLLHQIDSKWDYYAQYKVPFSLELRRDSTMRLIDVFGVINDAGTNYPNKVRIVQFIGKHDNSAEAHGFFLKQLDTDNVGFRRYVLRAIVGGTGIYGNDLYDKVKELLAKKKLKEVDALRYMREANGQRAIKEIQGFLSRTNNLEEYITAGHLLCFYRDSSLLAVLADRYPDFRHMPRKSFGDNPAFAFTNEMIREYLSSTDGEKLMRALEIASDDGTFGDKDLPILEKKLRSSTAVGRKAVVDFIIQNIKSGNASKEKALPILKSAADRETDLEIKRKLTNGIIQLGGVKTSQ